MRRYLRYLLVTCCCCWTTVATIAQETFATGTVLEQVKRLPVEGVSVKVIGSQTTTVTNANGQYSIRVKNRADAL